MVLEGRSRTIVMIETSKFNDNFTKEINKAAKEHGFSEEEKENLIHQLINLALQQQTQGSIDTMGRCVKQAEKIVQDYGVNNSDKLVSSWTPLLLYITSHFILTGLNQRSPLWKLDAYVDGTLCISPGD